MSGSLALTVLWLILGNRKVTITLSTWLSVRPGWTTTLTCLPGWSCACMDPTPRPGFSSASAARVILPLALSSPAGIRMPKAMKCLWLAGLQMSLCRCLVPGDYSLPLRSSCLGLALWRSSLSQCCSEVELRRHLQTGNELWPRGSSLCWAKSLFNHVEEKRKPLKYGLQ